ncbi:Ninjurin-2, partial [Lamprotornis superbus]
SMNPHLRINGPMNINHYATKKSVAESMLDVALFMANVTQLKAVLEQGTSFQYYATLIVLISISLFFQVMIGILLIITARLNLNDIAKQPRLNILNNTATALIFITVILNIFITAFGDLSSAALLHASTDLSRSPWMNPENWTQQETRHLSHCTFQQTAWQEMQVLPLLTSPPHTFPATHGSHVLDAAAGKGSSCSASLITPSSAVPCHQRALEAEEGFGHSAVCPSKVHIWMRWWTVLLNSSGDGGYAVFSWRRFHMPRFEYLMLLNSIPCLPHTHPVDLEVPQAPQLDSARGTNVEEAGTVFFPPLSQNLSPLTIRPLWGHPTVQPHDHGCKGHLAFHAVLPDGINDSSWEVDVEVTQEDNAVRVLEPI